MRVSKRFGFVLAAMAALLMGGAGLAPADGPSRPARPEEKAFHQQVMSTVERALPAPPDGWVVGRRTEVEDLKRVGEGAGSEPFQVDYWIEFYDPEGQRRAQEKMLRDGGAITKEAGDDQQNKDFEKQVEVLSGKIVKALEKGDMAEVNRLQAQLEGSAKAFESRAQSRDKRFHQLEVKHTQDLTAGIGIRVNDFHVDFREKPITRDRVAGMSVYRTAGSHWAGRGWVEGVSFVFLGPWRYLDSEGQHRMEARKSGKVGYTRAQTVVVMVQASEDRARELLQALNIKSLAGLIGRAASR